VVKVRGGRSGGAGGGWVEGDGAGTVVAGGAGGAAEAVVAVRSALYGVRITELYQGTAAKQGLRVDDIILSFDGTATPSFEALAAAVQQSGSEAEVIFINADNGQQESIVLYPQGGRIGVNGEAVQVSG
jgi:S1-C subfamily serine protease